MGARIARHGKGREASMPVPAPKDSGNPPTPQRGKQAFQTQRQRLSVFAGVSRRRPSRPADHNLAG